MSTSPQFQRTDKAILQAMVCLLKRKSFEKITVQDILEETPVTRATFYAHYRDKYEVVEKMLEHFIAGHGIAQEKLRAHFPASYHEIIRSSYLADREYAQALLAVHTDRVDFTKAIMNSHRNHYLAEHNTGTANAEARVYGAARTALYLSFLQEDVTDFSFDNINHILISAVMALFDIPEDDMETRVFLQKKITQNAAHLHKKLLE